MGRVSGLLERTKFATSLAPSYQQYTNALGRLRKLGVYHSLGASVNSVGMVSQLARPSHRSERNLAIVLAAAVLGATLEWQSHPG